MVTEEVEVDDPKHTGKKVKRTVPKHFPEGHPKAGELMIFQCKKDEEESGKARPLQWRHSWSPRPDPVYPPPDVDNHLISTINSNTGKELNNGTPIEYSSYSSDGREKLPNVGCEGRLRPQRASISENAHREFMPEDVEPWQQANRRYDKQNGEFWEIRCPKPRKVLAEWQGHSWRCGATLIQSGHGAMRVTLLAD